ncbi:MAG TPA: hypothetical protein VF476_06365, partial [Chitinophagaceae bacterium]
MKHIMTVLMIFFSLTIFSQQPQKANYNLAARFSPNKVNKMLFSTSVDPHWLKLSDRFWYVYETREGKYWYIVDAAKGTKRQLFDNAKLAAEITRIVRDPFDAQHLPIERLKFINNENSIQFEIKSSQDEEKKDTTASSGRRGGGNADRA